MNTKEIKEINVHFWILFNFAICAIMNDYIVYITKVNYGISLAISTILLIIGNFFLIKKKKLIQLKSDFEWYDLIFIILIISVMLLHIPIPDSTYDTINYHIYLQENIYIDKINFDFFAGKTINGFLFPLGDRIHYITRYLLGYRAGTILSYYSVIVLFYQTKKILNYLTGKRKLNSILSICCWLTIGLQQVVGSYYIDNFSVVFSLAIISFIILEKDCFISKSKLLYLTILTGILIGIKLPNILLIAPIILIYLIKRRKQLCVKNIPFYLICGVVCILPSIIYVIDNLIQTGSPLYPYYNNIFKSEYFGNYSWVEPLFGIPDWKYKLIWPIYTSLSRDGYGDCWYIIDPIWAIGYVVSIIYFIYGTIKYKKVNKEVYYLSIISLILTFLWIEFLYGYMRYGLIVPILYSIIVAYLYNKLAYYLSHILNIKFINFFAVILSVILILCMIITNIDSSDFNIIKENYPALFKDRNGVKIHLEDDGVWGVIGDDSSMTQILREDGVPIYNLQHKLFDGNEKTMQLYNKILDEHPNIYVISYGNYNKKIVELANNGLFFKLYKTYTADEIPYICKPYELFIFKVYKNTPIQVNSLEN